MGCAACIGDKSISVPFGYASALQTVLFWSIKKELKPSKLVPHLQFTKTIKQLQYSALSQKNSRKITSSEPQQEQPLVLSEDQKLKSKWKLLVLCLNDDFYQPQEYNTVNLGLQHSCFAQIQKDLLRTFPEQKFFQTPQGIVVFQRLLKRLALYFPAVGYTQGINFIVGYLLVQQFSQEQTFWMVVHMGMSAKFLLLGFFQDGFPMSSIYCRFLNHIFKSNLPNLFNHFEELGVAAQAWMFKWFMTYYLYSFPLPIAKQVWTLIMLKGSIGMVYFAFALLKQLQKQLLEFQDATQIIGFFQNFRDISTFYSLIDMKSLLQRAYSVQISNEEISTVCKQYISQTSINNFYIQYYSLSTQPEIQNQVLIRWQQKLRRERIQFRTTEKIIFQQNGITITKKLQPTIRINKPPKESKFRIKEEEFKKTKQKNFYEKNSLKASSIADQQPPIVNRSKISSHQSKASHVIEMSSISNNLKMSNHSSRQEQSHISRMTSQQSFVVDEPPESIRRQLTEQQISDGQVTARVNASVHVINQGNNQTRNSKDEEVQIFDFHQPFKKKKQGSSQDRSQLKFQQHIIQLPESMHNLNKKQTQKTIIEIGPSNIIYRQQTIFSIDAADSIDFEASNGIGESIGKRPCNIDFKYRTPQTIKSYQNSI